MMGTGQSSQLPCETKPLACAQMTRGLAAISSAGEEPKNSRRTTKLAVYHQKHGFRNNFHIQRWGIVERCVAGLHVNWDALQFLKNYPAQKPCHHRKESP